MPAAEPKATIPKITSAAFEDEPCTPPTALAAPADTALLPLALALILPVALVLALALSLPLALADPLAELDGNRLDPTLLLAAPLSVAFPISSNGGLQITTSTLLLKHSPRSWKLWPPFAKHMAVHGNGLPIALKSLLSQHAYMSQKAWSLYSASLLMTQPPERPTGRLRG